MSQRHFYAVFTKDGEQHRFDSEAGAMACARQNGGMIQKLAHGQYAQADNVAAALSGRLPKWEPTTVRLD